MKSKIQRTSNIVLASILVVTLLVALLFYLGGEVPVAHRVIYDKMQPSFTNLFLLWTVAVVCLAAVCLLFVVVRKIYVNFYNFSEVSRLRMMGTIGVILLLLVMWLLAHGVWTDMWLYSLSFLLILTLLLVLIFTVRRYWLNRKGRRHGTV